VDTLAQNPFSSDPGGQLSRHIIEGLPNSPAHQRLNGDIVDQIVPWDMEGNRFISRNGAVILFVSSR